MNNMKMTLAALAALTFATATYASASDDALLTRMAALNPDLHSYTATMRAHVALTSFPFLATDIVANVYHKDPDRNKVEITSGLPMIASQFGKLYPQIEPPARWPDMFTISRAGDDGAHTTYHLVPRKTGNVDRIDVVVDDKTATIASMRWNYANGGTAQMNNTYGTVDGNLVITAQNGTVSEPNYQGTVTASLSDYKINPQIDDSVFQQ